MLKNSATRLEAIGGYAETQAPHGRLSGDLPAPGLQADGSQAVLSRTPTGQTVRMGGGDIKATLQEDAHSTSTDLEDEFQTPVALDDDQYRAILNDRIAVLRQQTGDFVAALRELDVVGVGIDEHASESSVTSLDTDFSLCGGSMAPLSHMGDSLRDDLALETSSAK